MESSYRSLPIVSRMLDVTVKSDYKLRKRHSTSLFFAAESSLVYSFRMSILIVL